MRCVAAFLLLLLLPGLLLPAGMMLHVCRCETQRRSEPRACCATAPLQAKTSCCRQHERAPAESPAPNDPRIEPRCGCVWLPLPEPAFEPMTPDLALALPAPAAEIGVAQHTLAWATPTHPYCWPTADSRPPPPHRERNLPLRS